MRDADAVAGVVAEVYGAVPAPRDGWLLLEDPAWAPIPDQGWKLHVSATVISVRRMLRAVLPVLRVHGVTAKVAADLGALADLNGGAAGYSQVGKVVTAYPRGDEDAVALARDLICATRGIAGPRVPSDGRLRGSTVVSYRYGGFTDLVLVDDLGQRVPAIRAPDGRMVPDERGSELRLPPWVEDPFARAGIAEAAEPPAEPLFAGYLVLSVLHQAAKGGVYLALDPRVDPPRTCVIKEGRRHVATDRLNRDAARQALREADVLRSLAGLPCVPKVHAAFTEERNGYVVLEHVDGESLERLVARRYGEGRLLSGGALAGIGRRIGEAVAAVHDAGVAYRDLTPSNVMLAGDRIVLVDFELAHRFADPTPAYGWGTPGFVSPQQRSRRPPSVADDVFGLGATLFFAATGAQAPDAMGGDASSVLRLYRPDLPALLADAVAGMLDREPGRRPPTMREAAERLRHAMARRSRPGHPAARASSRTGPSLADAVAGASELLATAVRDPEGLRWDTRTPSVPAGPSAGAVATGRACVADLHNGVAGVGLFLGRIGHHTGSLRFVEAATDAAAWTVTRGLASTPLPGLHFGRAGLAAFLLELSEITGEQRHAVDASRIALSLTAGTTDTPDLTHGLAGIGLVHLRLARCGYPAHLAVAEGIGARLLGLQEVLGPDRVAWRHPAGPHAGISGEVLTGLAHGLAGVGFFLLQLWRVTGKRRYLDAALAAGATLSWSALPFGDQPGGVNWPMSLGASAVDASWLYWCHGATGIGLFLLALSQEEAGRDLAPLARRCAETVASVGARGGGTLCHGLPGNGLFLLRAHEVLGDERLLRRAQDMGAVLRSTACPTRAGMVWPGERPGLYTPDLMVGSAGTASFFLALAGTALPSDELRLPVV